LLLAAVAAAAVAAILELNHFAPPSNVLLMRAYASGLDSH
jgi:hypothetical protein